MNYEFSKPEKQIVRQIIETRLQRDFEYMIILQGLLANKTITEADLSGFSETTRNAILEIRRVLSNGTC